MRYYIVTTTKFSRECVEYLTYGASQANWLCNIDIGDTIFLSQFSYKSQDLFGPFRVSNRLYYDKSIIYPGQRYFYRIRFKPIHLTKSIEETDLYLHGIQFGNNDLYYKIINLIQQNKHLHCISLTDGEGEAITEVFRTNGSEYDHGHKQIVNEDIVNVDCSYIWMKNRLDKTERFSSESDMEAYIIMALKNVDSYEFESISTLLRKYPENNLPDSLTYNQFVLGNAYPSDIAIINKSSINVFELKKDRLAWPLIPQIEKEMKKHLYYSLFSNRVRQTNVDRFNFYLVTMRNKNNAQFRSIIKDNYSNLCDKIGVVRKNTLTFVEYAIGDRELLLEEVHHEQ
jgi:hypothetical protein